jgi:Dullard-like phosphatase family protein
LVNVLGKKTIVFDIDETLVSAQTCRKAADKIAYDQVIYLNGSKYSKVYLSFRPHLFDMLNELSKYFEIILYTCGTAAYAAAFTDCVQKKRPYFYHVLSISHCLFSPDNELYIKDLKILEEGRSLSDIIIVDNRVESFFLQITNGIPITDYVGDKKDIMLQYLTTYLMSFLQVADVRKKIEKDFMINENLKEYSERD